MWFSHVAKVPRREDPSPLLVIGNAVHAALEKFFGLRPAERGSGDEMLHRCLRAVWPESRKADSFATRDEERDYGQQALELLSTFRATFDTTLVPLTRERWVSTRLENGVELFGKVDRVDGRLAPADEPIDVVDYKTGRWQLDATDLPDEPAVQGYLLAAEAQYRRPVRAVRYLYLATGSESRWEPEREDVEAARESLLTVTWAMYRDQDFTPRPGAHCGRCPFAQHCPDAGRVEVADLHVRDDIAF